jgi:hypothetical protein
MNKVKCDVCQKHFDKKVNDTCPHCEYSSQPLIVKFTALHMSGDLTKGGMTYRESCDYIESVSCGTCTKDVERGGYACDGGWFLTMDILDTPCGEEWRIITDDEFKNLEYEVLLDKITDTLKYFVYPISQQIVEELISCFKQERKEELELTYHQIDEIKKARRGE